MLKNEREPFPSEQEKYIKRITSPKTPEDIVLAMQDPHSSVYKDVINMLLAKIEIEAIVEKLFEFYLAKEFASDEKAKAELIRHVVLTEAAYQTEMVRAKVELLEHERSVKSLKENDIQKLFTSCCEREKKIDVLNKKLGTYKGMMDTVKEEEEDNTKNWEKLIEKKEKIFKEKIEGIQLIGFKGEALGLEAATRFTDKLMGKGSPPPVKIVDIVSKSYSEAAKPPKDGKTSSTTPPPPPPPLTASTMVAKADAGNIIKALGDGIDDLPAGTNLGKALLEKLKKNNPALGAALKTVTEVKEDVEKIFAGAIDINKIKTQVENNLNQANKDITREKEFLEQEKNQYAKLNQGKKFDKNIPPPPPPAPPRPKNPSNLK